jgi:manganese-dependent inorganic pyrophosphatase
MKGKKVGVCQLELATLDQVSAIRADLLKGLEAVKAEGRHSVLMMLTDVVKEGTELIVLSDEPAVIEQAFGKKLSGGVMWIDGMMSRKKQTIPPLQKAFGC